MTRFASAPAWFLARTPRERWLLALMVGIAIPVIGWLLVARPLITGLDAARERHSAAVQRHGAVLAQLAQLEAAPRAPLGTGGSPLALRITDAAARAGVQLTTNEPRGPGSATITIAATPPAAGLSWLRQLEAAGIRIRELSITPQGPGSVAISATLADGAAS